MDELSDPRSYVDFLFYLMITKNQKEKRKEIVTKIFLCLCISSNQYKIHLAWFDNYVISLRNIEFNQNIQ